MDGQDHKIAATAAGHEGHDVHLCHRCGWPFPNPHPSAKHRRAHKRVCGTIEGYKIIHSEEHDQHTVVSDDDQSSDENEHTPIPMPVKKNVGEEIGSSGGPSGMSNRSEDDVFTDAATEFSDSGISPQSVERLESAVGLNKGAQKQNLDGDFHGIESLKVNETADKTEPFNDVTNSKESRNPGSLVNANDQSGTVSPITDSKAEEILVGFGNSLQDDVIKSETLRGVVGDSVEKGVTDEIQHNQREAGQDSDIQGEEQKLASVNVDSKEGIIPDPALLAVERKEELQGKLVSENTNVSAGVEKVSASAEDVKSIGVVDDILPEESLLNEPSLKPAGSTLSQAATEPSDAAFSIEEEIKQKFSVAEVETAEYNGLAGNDEREGEKCNVDGNENGVLKSKDICLVETVPVPGSAENTFAAEDDPSTKVLKGDVNYCEEKSDRKSLDAVIEKGGGDSEEVKVILESTSCLDNSADFPCSSEADGGARNVEELSLPKPCTMESNHDRSFQGLNSDKLNEELQSVDTVSMDAGLNQDGVLGKVSVTGTPNCPASQLISELPNNIHAHSNVGLKSAPVAGTVEEIKKPRGVVASESTPEQPISEESKFTDSDVLNDISAKENKCTGKDVRDLDNTKVSTELNRDGNVSVCTEISESANQIQQEKKCSDETFPEAEERLIVVSKTSPDTEERHAVEDISPSEPFGIVPNAETSDSNVATSEKCSVTPSLKEPVPLSFQETYETSAAGDDKTVINVETAASANSKSLQDQGQDKLTKPRDIATTMDLPDNSSAKSESLNPNCGTVSELSIESNIAVAGTISPPDSLITSSQQHKMATEEAHHDKSDVFEPPSFMTLVQPDDKSDRITTASEIETVQTNQQLKSDDLQAGWFPTLANVVNESEGRKKNEVIIAKVTNSSPVKNHSPLKNLLNEAKSPKSKQVPTANLNYEAEPGENGVGVTTVASDVDPEVPAPNDHDTHKDIDGWNSPARYPIETKKEKKKGKSYWVPFMCCSSVHKDL